MCVSVLEGVIHQMVQDMASRCDLPQVRAITLGRFLDVLVKCPVAGIPEARMCQRVPHLVFHVSMAKTNLNL